MQSRRSFIAVTLLALTFAGAIACANGGDATQSAQGTVTGDANAPPPAASATTATDEVLDAGAATPRVDAGDAAYTYGEWSAWSNCSVTCDAGVKTRTRECQRRDGIAVNCAHCGDQCVDTTPCTASICCAPRDVCCPKSPHNVIGPMSWCNDTIAALAADCLDAGCLWTGATACSNGGSSSNATLPGGEGTCQ